MDDAVDALVESERQIYQWLLDWRAEIDAIENYAEVPVHLADEVTVAPAHVVPRLGPILTAMARRARHLHQGHLSMGRNPGYGQDHPDVHASGNTAYGARQVLALGLGVHLGLSAQHADWLAQGLVGYELPMPAVEARKREERDRRE